MIKKCNVAVRDTAQKNNVPLWMVADLMHISESQLMKRIRFEWPEEEQQRVIELINEYVKGEANDGH